MERVRTVVRHQEAESEPHRRLHRSCVQTEAQRREQLRALQQLIWQRDIVQFEALPGLSWLCHQRFAFCGGISANFWTANRRGTDQRCVEPMLVLSYVEK